MFLLRSFITAFIISLPSFLSALVVKDIKIDGLNRFSEPTVIVYSSVAVGDDLTDIDIKAII